MLPQRGCWLPLVQHQIPVRGSPGNGGVSGLRFLQCGEHWLPTVGLPEIKRDASPRHRHHGLAAASNAGRRQDDARRGELLWSPRAPPFLVPDLIPLHPSTSIDSKNAFRVRIFTPSGELPFAGHPNTGTATVLGWRGEVFGRAVGAEMVFEEDAGLVAVTLLPGQDGRPAGARLVAPQRYSSAGAVGRSEVAACLGLAEEDIEVANHAPLVGSVGLPFVLGPPAGAPPVAP